MTTFAHEQIEAARRELSAQSPSGMLLNFAGTLTDAGLLDSGELWYFLDKPYKWAGEWLLWLQHGEPAEGDDSYEAFVESADAYQKANS